MNLPVFQLSAAPQGPAGPEAGSEAIELLAASGGSRIEHIVSRGSASPEGFWYDQDDDEFVAVLAGRGTLLFEDGREVTLGPGEAMLIPRRVRHRVSRTEDPTVWLAVHLAGPADRDHGASPETPITRNPR